MTRHTLIALALGGCTVTLLPACHKEQQQQVQTEDLAVKVFKLKKQQVTDTHEWFGYLRGKMDTDIHPRVSGFLVSQEYKDGTFVKAGDILFKLDPDLYEAEYAQAQANLSAAQATLASAQATREQLQLDVDRYTQLVKTSAASEKDLSDAQHNLRAAIATVDSAQAEVEQQKAAVNKAKINLDYTLVRAPYSGIVGAALASKGDLVSPETRLTNMTSIDPIRVDFSINSDRLIQAFRKYGTLGNTSSDKNSAPSIQIQMEDGSIYPYTGSLLSIESKVEPNGLINVEAEIPNPDGILRGGMPVRVLIKTDQKEALLVPQAAIRTVLRSDFIMIVDKDNIPHSVPVTNDGVYEIPVEEEDGYVSLQKMVAIKGRSTPLSETLSQYGYSNPEEVIIVCDPENGVRAMNISSANSRRGASSSTPPEKIKISPFTFRPELTVDQQRIMDQLKSGEKPEDNPNVEPTLPPFPVKVTPLLQQDIAVTDEWFGNLRGVEETEIRPKVSGFLLKQHFKNGSLVKSGDVLFTIDPAPYQAALDEAKANLLSAHAALEQANAKLEMSRQNYDRYIKLTKTARGAVSEKTVTDAKTAVKTNEAAVLKAQATVAQMKAAVKLAEINLGYTTITAPFDGRVGISKPSIGALVGPSDIEPLVTISSLNPIRVDFNISGKDALRGIANYGRSITNKDVSAPPPPPFNIVLEDGSVYPAEGHVITSNNSLNTTTGTLQIIGHIENVDGGLRSGMPVRVRAGLNQQKGAFLVPARAPLSASGKDCIVLLRPDNAPEMLPISKGSIVTIPVDGVVQPMQVIDIDRPVFTGMVLAKMGTKTLEETIFQSAGVKNWDELLLKREGVDNFRALIEKKTGSRADDTALDQAGVEDWKSLTLKNAGTSSSRELLLKESGLKDELDLIAQVQGYSSPMEMVLKEMGFNSLDQTQVVVEGSTMAAQVYGANKASGSHANKLTPLPFHYSTPKTVVDSITADPSSPNSQASSPDTINSTHTAEEK